MAILKTVKVFFVVLYLLLAFSYRGSAADQSELTIFEKRVLMMVYECRDEVVNEFSSMLSRKELTFNQLFDTFYIPIADTSPQKFSTQYDKLTDERLRIILDKYLAKDSRLLYVVAADRNGYVPTHNSRYSKPLTDDTRYNAQNNRTKRLFNDRTGLAAARNTNAFLLQKYERDTGESLYDLSAPIFINDKHWGAVRIGFKKERGAAGR